MPGTVSSFTAFHDIVDLTQLSDTLSDATAVLNPLTDVLTVTGDNGSVQLQLDKSENYTGVLWQTASDSNGGTDVSVTCYCRGTMILTPEGEVAVERLAIGDLLVALTGAARPIRWIGRRGYSGRFVTGNRAVLPICIKPDAIVKGVPARNLWVSPEHSLYIEDVCWCRRSTWSTARAWCRQRASRRSSTSTSNSTRTT